MAGNTISNYLLMQTIKHLRSTFPAPSTPPVRKYRAVGEALAVQLEAGLLKRVAGNERAANSTHFRTGPPKKLFIIDDEEKGTSYALGTEGVAEALGFKASGIRVRLSRGGGRTGRVVQREDRSIFIEARPATEEEIFEYQQELSRHLK